MNTEDITTALMFFMCDEDKQDISIVHSHIDDRYLIKREIIKQLGVPDANHGDILKYPGRRYIYLYTLRTVPEGLRGSAYYVSRKDNQDWFEEPVLPLAYTDWFNEADMYCQLVLDYNSPSGAVRACEDINKVKAIRL